MIVTTSHKLRVSFSHLELILRSQGCQKSQLLVLISSNEKGLDIYEKSLDIIYTWEGLDIYEKGLDRHERSLDIYEKSLEMYVYLWESLIVLMWPCVVDRMLQSFCQVTNQNLCNSAS